ncbi:MAG: glycoside hydrolase family 97 protein [Bacteroidales bacterium]|nr:glycoside hydrolase family 97 protein [Bacteroidales bacterium]
MSRLRSLILLLLLAIFVSPAATQSLRVRRQVASPDGTIQLSLSMTDAGEPRYSVTVDGKPFILPSELGFDARGDLNLRDGFHFFSDGTVFFSMDNDWTCPWGVNKQMHQHGNVMMVCMQNSTAQLCLELQVFNDGFGFRYSVLANHADSIQVTDELTRFRFARDGDAWAITPDYNTYEFLYHKQLLSQMPYAATPMTFRTADGLYGSIHEAALVDFPEMMLYADDDSLCFRAELAEWPDGVKARFNGDGFISPWRTCQIARDAVGLINSSLILNLNEPSKLPGDCGWIRPMKYIGVWWGMHLGIQTWAMDDRHGATTENALRYIDFAADNNIDAVLFEGWNEGWENWGGSQRFDYTRPYADFDVERICRHARERGVAIISHHETGGNIYNYERQLDTAYQWLADHGIHCVKTGYAGGFPDGHSHHGQFAVRHYQRVVETAARYHVMLDVHEPIKPTGLCRTWPNLMTGEGARGMEWNAWSDGNPPEHHEILPFTRLLAGPMDYTPGTFDILFTQSRDLPQRRKWNDQDKGTSRVNTTLAKQLANWVILYSPLQMASDLIENYAGHPAFQFFRDFDPDCDWSSALAGEIGEYVVVVRRAGERYFLGASTNEDARTVSVPLLFLKEGEAYVATIYADAPDADWKSNPTAYTITQQRVVRGDVLTIRMAPGGGQAVLFELIKK